MKYDKRHRNTLISILIFISLCGLTFMIPWNSMFAGGGILIATIIVGLIAGGFLILMRLFGIKIAKTNLLYNYLGTLNLLLGLFLLIVGILNRRFVFPLLMILNVFIGGMIFFDIFRSQKDHN